MENKIQFSKILVCICILLPIIAIPFAVYMSIVYLLDATISIAIITLSGSIALTSVVWMLKKSQAENVIKIYMAAYKELNNLRPTDNSFLENCEEHLVSKIDQSFDNSIDDATNLIEREEIIL